MNTFKGLFIDDDKSDKTFIDHLQINETLHFAFEIPEKGFLDLTDFILSENLDILALDYRLDGEPVIITGDKSPNRYKAGVIAQQLREEILIDIKKDFPIILVSHEDRIKEYFEPDKTAHDLFDLRYCKEDLASSLFCKDEVVSLIKAYKAIIRLWEQENRLDKLLDFPINKFYPQDALSINEAKAPHQLSRLIFKNIIQRTGFLIDKNDLFAILGINHNSEEEEVGKLEKVLMDQGVNYNGIFSEGWLRWKKNELTNWTNDLCNIPFGDLTAQERVDCLNEKFSLSLNVAQSRWDNNSTNAYFAVSCSSCFNPTELSYTVETYDTKRPFSFIDRKYICWSCIQTGENERQRLPSDQKEAYIVEKIINGEI